jgi:hypothetical protein
MLTEQGRQLPFIHATIPENMAGHFSSAHISQEQPLSKAPARASQAMELDD